MCERTRTALEIISSASSKKSLSRREQIMLFEKVMEDARATASDIKEVKKDVAEVKTDVVLLKSDIKDIKDMLTRRSVWAKIPLLKEIPNLAWILLIILICVVGSILGANLDFLQNAFHIGG